MDENTGPSPTRYSINGNVTPNRRTPNGNVQDRDGMGRRRDSKGNVIESTIRTPVSHSIMTSPSPGVNESDDETQALLSRYKYYTKLAPHKESIFQMPEHIVPDSQWIKILVPMKEGKQNSIITIFSLWNTMMGTSILSMPWALQQAGFITGICLLIFMAGVMLYTSYRILKSTEAFAGDDDTIEFSSVCRHYLGQWAEIAAVICSLLTLLGGAVVYWILMSNFLFNVVSFIYYKVETTNNTVPLVNTTAPIDALCPKHDDTPGGNESLILILPHLHHSFSVAMETSQDIFEKVWDKQETVPFFLIAILFPLLNFKSPTFFTKFNSLGTISVTYLVCFIAVKAVHWGINIDFNTLDIHSAHFAQNFKTTFPALTGIAALAYFVQNCCVAICRNQKNPKNNARDLTIAYVLVCCTYVYMGAMFFVAFPLNKSCIRDNLLDNISTTDVLAFVARIGLFFQMLTVFPLLLYIFRIQFLKWILKKVWPNWWSVVLLNVVVVGMCVVFAVFEPHIGKIIGFVGAFCGFSYAIALPCLVHMVSSHTAQGGSQLTWVSAAIHMGLILLGLANFIGQFVIIGHTS